MKQITKEKIYISIAFGLFITSEWIVENLATWIEGLIL